MAGYIVRVAGKSSRRSLQDFVPLPGSALVTPTPICPGLNHPSIDTHTYALRLLNLDTLMAVADRS